MYVYVLSHVWLFVTWWTIAHQAPLSIGFYRQEYWSGLPYPPLGDLPNPGIEPWSSALQEDSLPLNHLVSLKSQYGILQIYFKGSSLFFWAGIISVSLQAHNSWLWWDALSWMSGLNKEEVESPHLPQTGECGLDVLTLQHSFYIMSRNWLGGMMIKA